MAGFWNKVGAGAVDSVGYAAKDGLKTFMWTGLIVGGATALLVGALTLASGGVAAALIMGGGVGLAAGVGSSLALGAWGAAWGLITGPFRGAKQRAQERANDPDLAQGLNRQQELEMLRAQNAQGRAQLDAAAQQLQQMQTQVPHSQYQQQEHVQREMERRNTAAPAQEVNNAEMNSGTLDAANNSRFVNKLAEESKGQSTYAANMR